MIERPDISSCSLTQDVLFKVPAILRAAPSTIKTPYQLDLEIRDRKPNIVPKVGDKAKIKSRAWYEKWKTTDSKVMVPLIFIEDMKEYCGQILTVGDCRTSNGIFRVHFKEDGGRYSWTLEMFEEVYPQKTLFKISEEKEPELQTIKRHRFIKLEKL